MISRARVLILLVPLLSIATPGAATAADAWVRVTSPHFVVVSNSNDKRARDVAWQFEQIRAAMLAIWPWMRGDLDRPVLVVAAKDENTMKLLAPQVNGFHAGAYAMLANVLATGPAEKRSQAIPMAQKAITLAPRDAFANSALALSLWNVGSATRPSRARGWRCRSRRTTASAARRSRCSTSS